MTAISAKHEVQHSNIAVDLIDPAPRNPNYMAESQFDAMVNVIKTDGFFQPILIRVTDDDRYEIVDGHHRLRAAKELGYERIQSAIVDMSRDKAEAIAIAMNRLRGDLDLSTVSQMFVDLTTEGWEVTDLVTTGFSEDEVKDLLEMGREVSGDALDDFSPPPDDNQDSAAPTYSLELEFTTAADKKLARKALKKAAGKGGTLADGMLALLD